MGCTLGPREQINQVTAYLDASVIYGSSVEESNDLRLFKGGLMKTQPGPASSTKGLLPAEDNIIDCRSKNDRKYVPYTRQRQSVGSGLSVNL